MKRCYATLPVLSSCGLGVFAAELAPLVAVLEEHGEALTHWQLMVEEGHMERLPHTVIHIDSHSDFRMPVFKAQETESKMWAGPWDRSAILNSMAAQTQIDNFLLLAAWLGLTDDIIYMAPPWHRYLRPGLEYKEVQIVIGLLGEEFRAAMQPKIPALLSEMDHNFIISWKERQSLRDAAEFRFRLVPAEHAVQFLQSAELFKDRSHQRLLVDFDLDALSTHNPRALQLTGKYFTEEELTALHRAIWNLTWDLVAPFEDALGERDPASKKIDMHAKMSEACSRCGSITAAYHSGSFTQVVKALVNKNDAKWVGSIIDEAASMPYQVSDTAQLSVLESFWATALKGLPVSPVALTIARSPFFSPRESVHKQECLVLGIAQKLWPAVASLRVGDHITAWHQRCTWAHLVNFSINHVGQFANQRSTKKLWQLAVPEGVSEVFGGGNVPDGTREIRFVNMNSDIIEVFWKGPASEVSHGTLGQTEALTMTTYIGHKFVARCKGHPSTTADYIFEVDDTGDLEIVLPMIKCDPTSEL